MRSRLGRVLRDMNIFLESIRDYSKRHTVSRKIPWNENSAALEVCSRSQIVRNLLQEASNCFLASDAWFHKSKRCGGVLEWRPLS